MRRDGTLGVLAGAGALPKAIISAAVREGRSVYAIAFQGHTDPATVAAVPHLWTRMGKAGAIISRLRQENVTDLVMAGAIRRPSVRELRPDWYAARFFSRIGRRALGDDGLLRAVTRTLEEEGFTVLGASDIVGNLLAPAGNFGTKSPSEQEWADIRRGIDVARALGALDVGQASVVQQGIVLGVEGAEGTDGLIVRTTALARSGQKPVLVKLAKPQQDIRLDLPTIGLGTVESIAVAGFGGIAIEAGRTIVLDMDKLGEAADRLGVFVTGIQPES